MLKHKLVLLPQRFWFFYLGPSTLSLHVVRLESIQITSMDASSQKPERTIHEMLTSEKPTANSRTDIRKSIRLDNNSFNIQKEPTDFLVSDMS